LSGRLRIKDICGRLKIKDIYGSESLINKERHLALEMLTLEMAHPGRKSENTPAKQHEGKA
jgi:hypothetical protein